MKRRDGIYLLIILGLAVLCSHLWEENRRRGVVAVIDKDTIITEPTATGSKPVGTLTVSVPKIGVDVPKLERNVPKSAIFVPKLTKNVPKREISEVGDTIATNAEEAINVTDRGDSYDVDIPITQKRFEDSLYTAWVSGYRATLDSIRVRERTVIIAGEPRAAKRQKIHIGLTGGVGLVGLKGDTGAGWFVGVGVTVPLWPK